MLRRLIRRLDGQAAEKRAGWARSPAGMAFRAACGDARWSRKEFLISTECNTFNSLPGAWLPDCPSHPQPTDTT